MLERLLSDIFWYSLRKQMPMMASVLKTTNLWSNTMKHPVHVGVLLACLAVTSTAQADVIDWLGWEETRPDIKGLSTVYVGVGISNAFVNANVEAPTPYGNVYAKMGQFYDGQGVAGQVGWRYPYAMTGVDKNGYYLGGFVGHIENDSLDFERYNRLGGAAELSYVWMNAQRMGSASIAIGAGEQTTGKNGEQKFSKPMMVFSITFGIGAF